MHNFVYHNPTKVLFGRGTIAQSGDETCTFGRRVMLVYGRSFARSSGLLDEVSASLRKAGAEVIYFGDVRPNPVHSHVMQGVQLAKDEKIEVVCGLGGGSVIDTAKAIAAGARVKHDVWKFFTGKKSIKEALPVIAVSTLAAAGSELNSGMVLTHEEKQLKFGFAHRLLFPKVAIMDPELTFSVSPQYTAYGAIDALAHLLEFYMTSTHDYVPVQQRYMEGLAAAIIESCDRALANPRDYEARSSLMWAAALALNGLAASGLGKVGFPMHLIEHSLSALYDIPHGAGLSVVIPGWLRRNAEEKSDRIKQIFSMTALSVTDRARSSHDYIDLLTDWFKGINSPTALSDLGIDAASIPEIAENALPLARVWRMREYDAKEVETVLRLCA